MRRFFELVAPALLAVALFAGSQPLAAQVVGVERRVSRDGVPLDFASDGVWRRRAAAVAATRVRLRSRARFDLLNQSISTAAANGGALTGALYLPTVLLAFNDTDTTQLAPAASYDSVFYTATPLAGRPYTIRTLYEEMSNGQLTIGGQAYGWQPASNSTAYYLDACGAMANALDCPIGRDRMGDAFREAIAAMDGAVDFGMYDNDGLDDTPNSGDDDGVVDVIQFVQPVLGGECGGSGIWAHKYALANIGGTYTTDDPAPGGGFVTINSYFVVSGVGGPQCQGGSDVMAIGISSHELGHGLGLPDLYDTGGGSAGIGEWGLMGSGIYTSLVSPTHMSAWSKEQMGWVWVRELAASGSYALGPVVASDTVFMIRARGNNPRGEYFLLENKQAVGADTANIWSGGLTGPKDGGMLVWHVDSAKIAQSLAANTVNAGATHGVAVVEADGNGSLRYGTNRGDAGDVFPGSDNNTGLSFATVPAALRNSDGGFAGFQLSAITQVVPGGAVSFELVFGDPTVVRASDPLAEISVDGVPYSRFEDLFEPARDYVVSIEATQTSSDGRSDFVFQSWSDGGARSHTVTDPTPGDSIVANVDARHRLLVAVSGQGAVTTPLAIDLIVGSLIDDDSTVTLSAVAGTGMAFGGWTGDTTGAEAVLELPMRRPFDVTATFLPVVSVTLAPLDSAVMGLEYSAPVGVGGGAGVGTYSFDIVQGSLPAGLTLARVGGSGLITGIPEEIGAFPVRIGVTSGNVTAERDFELHVAAPALSIDGVLERLLGQPSSLTDADVRYLDLLGNRNDRFDVGDFLAWMEATQQ